VAPTIEIAEEDEPLDDLDVGDIVTSVVAMARGGRIEEKLYKNLNGSKRRYYVFRWEAKHSNGSRYRPTRYIGLTPGARPDRIGPDDRAT
jgi:hypothetical protein